MSHFTRFSVPAVILGAAMTLCSAAPIVAAPASDDWRPGNLVANGDFSKGDLGAVPEGWTLKAPNSALRPEFKLVDGPSGQRLLQAAGNGRKECFGTLVHPVELAGGKTYRLRVRFRIEGIDDVNRHLLHGVFASGFNGAPASAVSVRYPSMLSR